MRLWRRRPGNGIYVHALFVGASVAEGLEMEYNIFPSISFAPLMPKAWELNNCSWAFCMRLWRRRPGNWLIVLELFVCASDAEGLGMEYMCMRFSLAPLTPKAWEWNILFAISFAPLMPKAWELNNCSWAFCMRLWRRRPGNWIIVLKLFDYGSDAEGLVIKLRLHDGRKAPELDFVSRALPT
jgi:hypothetical protein